MDATHGPATKSLAAVCAAPERLHLTELLVPSPSAGELLLRLNCCGLCGTDLHKIARDSHVGKVLGHELVGTISAVGNDVEGFAVGDRVVTPHHVACGQCRLCEVGAETSCASFRREQIAPGGFSEWILVREAAVRQAARVLPESLSDEAAVFLEPAACVLRGIDRSGLPAVTRVGRSPRVVLLGGGSMGLLHLLVLRALDAEARVVVSEPIEERRSLAAELGATEAVHPERLDEEVARLFGEGADAVFDTVGSPGLLEPSLSLLRSGGTLVLFAHFENGAIGAVHETLFRQERRIVGTYSAAVGEQRRIFELLESGDLDPRPLVTHHLPLTRIEEAIRLSRRRSALKILLEPAA